MIPAAFLLRILMFSGQKRFDETTLTEEQSLWKARMVVLRPPNTAVKIRFLSLESFPYWYAPLHPATRKKIFERTLRAGHGPPSYTKLSVHRIKDDIEDSRNQTFQIERYCK